MSDPVRVLFVCTGNLCRSPLARAMLDAEAARLGLGDHLATGSAGTHARDGTPSPALQQEIALTHGLDLSAHRARRLCAQDFVDFDVLVALDLGHLDHLNFMRPPDARARQMLLLSGVDEAGTIEVPDPYGGSARAYAHAAGLIRVGVRHLLAHLLPAQVRAEVSARGR